MNDRGESLHAEALRWKEVKQRNIRPKMGKDFRKFVGKIKQQMQQEMQQTVEKKDLTIFYPLS